MINKCVEKLNHSQVKFEENQSKFILENSKRELIDKIIIDDCIYLKTDTRLRCDYAINYKDKTILIELKGSDLKHALKQILQTIEDNKFTININRYAVIVTSRTPQFDSTIQKLKKQLKQQKITLIHGNSPISKKLADFI